MHHGFPELDVFIGGYRAQGLHRQRMPQGVGATLHFHLNRLADMIVEHALEAEELGNRFAIDGDENISRRQYPGGTGSRLHVVDHEHAGQFRVCLAHTGLGVRIQPKPPQFVVGGVLEHRFERATRHRLAGLDELQRSHDCRQRQVKARLRALRPAGIQRDHTPIDVDDGRAGGAAGCTGGSLVIKRIEVVVLAVAVFRRLAIESRQGAREYRQLLARIVADDADFAANDRPGGIQRQLRRLDEAQFCRVVAINSEIVHRVPIDRVKLNLLAILKRRLRDDGSRHDHVSIGQNEAPLGIDDEARGLCGCIPLGVECTCAVDLDAHDTARDAVDGLRPCSRSGGCGRYGRAQRVRDRQEDQCNK